MPSNEFPGMIRIPMRAVSKARPKVPREGKAYMPKEYVAAKEEFFRHLAKLKVPREEYEGAVALEVVFGANDIWLQVVPVDVTKPKYMRTKDLDNIVGFVMDALQDAGVIENDSQVVSIQADYRQEGE